MGGRTVPVGAVAYVLLVGVLWGTVAIVVRVLVRTIDATLIAFVRILIGSIVITLILFARKGFSIPGTRLRFVLPAALGISMNYLLFTIGLRYTSASAAAIIVQSEVVLLAILSVLLLGLGPRKRLGMGMALIGVFIVTWNGKDLQGLLGSQYFLGNLIVFTAGFFWAVYVYFQRRMAEGPDILIGLAPIFLIAALILFPTSMGSLASLIELSLLQVLAFLYLSVVCMGLGYIILAEGMRKIPMSTAGVLLTVMPVTSVSLAVILLREAITVFLVTGALLDLAGVILVVTGEASPS